ncbi:MAG: F0F1 ATP synthase subunit A [Gemmatimonadales bacterium]|nr:F0F1 ATP synthase subunit A [Gemmatimonadales bacterium]
MMRFGRAMAVAAALLGAGSGVGATPAAAQEHERTREVAEDLVAPESQHEANQNQIDIVHHIGNAHEVEIPFLGVYPLPHFAPIHIGSLAIDLSPTKHLVFMLLAALLVTIVFLVSARGVARAQAEGRPAKGFAGAMEATALYIRQEVILPNVGHHGEGFVPYLLTLFFFILAMNLLGLLPWGATATGNIAVTAALALMAFVVIEVAGMRALGARGYLQTIFYLPPGLPGWLKPVMLVIMTPVEIIGKLSKPFALAVRLFANMTAGHVLVLALIGLTFLFQSYVIGLGASVLATAIMLLELFVAFLQAFVFTLLTSVFIGLMRAEH